MINQKQGNYITTLIMLTCLCIVSLLIATNVISWTWIPGLLIAFIIVIFKIFLQTKAINTCVEEAKKNPKQAKGFFALFLFISILINVGLLAFVVLLPQIFNIFSFIMGVSIIIITIIVCQVLDNKWIDTIIENEPRE